MRHPFTFTGAVMLLLTTATLSGMTLVREGRPEAVIRIPERESAELRMAAQELQLLVRLISGAELPIHHVGEIGGDGAALWLGRDFADPFPDDLDRLRGSDGYAVRAKEGRIHVFGATDRGTLGGIYALLHHNTDLIFARPRDGMVFSETPTLTFQTVDFLERPAWDAVEFGLVAEHFNIPTHRWSMRNGGNARGMFYSKYHIDSALGMFFRGEIGYELGSMLPADPWFETHPDYFSLKQGVRQPYQHYGPQLCYRNLNGADQVAENILARLREDLTPDIRKVHLGFGDTWDLCTCDACMEPVAVADGSALPYGHEAHRSTQYYPGMGTGKL